MRFAERFAHRSAGGSTFREASRNTLAQALTSRYTFSNASTHRCTRRLAGLGTRLCRLAGRTASQIADRCALTGGNTCSSTLRNYLTDHRTCRIADRCTVVLGITPYLTGQAATQRAILRQRLAGINRGLNDRFQSFLLFLGQAHARNSFFNCSTPVIASKPIPYGTHKNDKLFQTSKGAPRNSYLGQGLVDAVCLTHSLAGAIHLTHSLRITIGQTNRFQHRQRGSLRYLREQCTQAFRHTVALGFTQSCVGPGQRSVGFTFALHSTHAGRLTRTGRYTGGILQASRHRARLTGRCALALLLASLQRQGQAGTCIVRRHTFSLGCTLRHT